MAPPIDPRAIPELTPEEKRLQRILKGVVIGLAVLILIVLGLIVVKMVGGGKKKAAPPPVAAEQTALPAGPAFGVRDVVLPPGSQVAETTIGAGTLALRVRGADGAETLIVLDLASGAERGRFVLKVAQ